MLQISMSAPARAVMVMYHFTVQSTFPKVGRMAETAAGEATLFLSPIPIWRAFKIFVIKENIRLKMESPAEKIK